ncbi:MAG: NADH-quinone oxidoreductase subunit M [Gemmatimonadetes bacterium]|nr:NADH-quinone oxidoreductase subunit M [Gemmatimonadota bacterium]MBT4608640.1 NADH-quinone oxidoreductase subunit M [Gemmatimonadota bacterium]MBT5059393.1 NADH-quinone oxidoreductase subunit M [Gemmatimonadota bacterium]MBT5146312.1 NADH-quinone oxidoreductase subunit M [Gemmatimonadota bacterium]MBT5591235.1 NADH-quinone oxidoreductase subunit M [Gemmatimonadota bacterium]
MDALPLLSAILLSPVLGLGLILLVPGGAARLVRWISLVSATVASLLSIHLWHSYDTASGGLQFVERLPWVEALGISYHLGVDGFGTILVMLNSIVYLTGVLTMWELTERVKGFFGFMLLLVVGVYGVFMSQDLFFFFFFYEIAVVPMYPLILIWGSGNRDYAAMKLMLFLLAGSALLFPALLTIYHSSGLGTFDMVLLSQHHFDPDLQIFLYPLIYLGFGVLAGMFPIHGWSPTGHVAAPSAVSMLHAGVLMKLGAFGILSVGIRLLPVGATYWAPTFTVLATIGIVYGAFVAIRQTDFKFVIGFSSVSHMGIVLLGLNLATLGQAGDDALNGAVFQMFAHGIMTALFFSTVGFIYDRAHSKTIADFGGLGAQMPRAVSIFIVAGLCGAGLPGLASFWAELLVFLAALKTYPLVGLVIIGGLVLTAVYILRVFREAFFGEVNPRWESLRELDLVGWQLLPRAILVGVLLFFGFFPRALLDVIDGTTTTFLARFWMQ